jgi:hypothetical protein
MDAQDKARIDRFNTKIKEVEVEVVNGVAGSMMKLQRIKAMKYATCIGQDIRKVDAFSVHS